MNPRTGRTNFDDPGLHREIMDLRRVDDYTNLLFLAFEYGCLALVVAGAVSFAEYRTAWGLAWGWNVPVFAVAMILMGAIQHRLAGLGHEASHYSFMRNRWLNDLVPDLFCMFPLLTTVHFYRLFHMAHHQYTNDPARDPDLQNFGHWKRSDEFPMSRSRFIRVIYFAVFVAPIRFLRYQGAYVRINSLGQGQNAYVDGRGRPDPVMAAGRHGARHRVRRRAERRDAAVDGDRSSRMADPGGRARVRPGRAVTWRLPERALFQSPFRQAYSPRVGSVIRLAYFTVLVVVLGQLRWATAGQSAVYFSLLWLIPMSTTFMFFMFLRDVYQHSNADDGRLTNSRVFFTDPFTRWAVFVYGQDMHIPHHLFPAIPHYRLRHLHQLLQRDHGAYRQLVVETHGTFRDPHGRPTILDEMTRPRGDEAIPTGLGAV